MFKTIQIILRIGYIKTFVVMVTKLFIITILLCMSRACNFWPKKIIYHLYFHILKKKKNIFFILSKVISLYSSTVKWHIERIFWQCSVTLHFTWILSGTPVLSIRLATFTVLPQMSYWGFLAPITPATTGPMLRPKEGNIITT